MRLRAIALIVFISGVFGSIAGISAAQLFDNGSDGGTASTTLLPAATDSPATGDDSGQQTSFTSDCLSAADVYEQVRPSVVEITSAISNGFGPQGRGTGTGIVIDTEGNILTNNHVIAGANTIEVHFADGETATARVVGRDPANDLAVVQVDPSGLDLTPADLGDSDSLRVGDPVLAIGNPFNLEATLTQGIVSAIDRTYTPGTGTRPIREMIQTDAAVNPGNSGGPLLNCRGQVIGVNSLLENPSGDSVNVGVAFAVAVNTAKRSLPDMLSGETVSHPWLGIAGMDVTPALAEELGLGTDSGVYVTLVSQGSPADDLGLQGAFASQNQAASSDEVQPGGDVIVAVDGEPVGSIDDLAGYLDREKRPGDEVELSVVRSGESLSLTATLADWPA
jgi:putative serine protease PepD